MKIVYEVKIDTDGLAESTIKHMEETMEIIKNATTNHFVDLVHISDERLSFNLYNEY